ncbi:MAG: FlgD immunoglobulin-like domain containing protein [Candidatus Cloacimonadota bacterium]|nr:FlgD immunoglobulin-like domain containing protein [Candidatus Cloacimonadota bacterium]
MRRILIILLVVVFSALNAVTIYDIQYPEDASGASPYVGQEVTTTGIVTAVGFKGYDDNIFISMPEGGEFSGIYCYAIGNESLQLGDEIEITATVEEYYEFTELVDATNVTVLSSGNPVPEPVNLTTQELSTMEEYESVLVKLTDVYVSSAPDEYGEWYVVDETTITAQIDDGFFYLDSVDPPIVVEVGQSWGSLIGIVDYSYDEYALNPRTPEDMTQESNTTPNTVPAAAKLEGNYPNPFNPETTVFFTLTNPEKVEVAVYNLQGKKVKTLANSDYSAGQHQIIWNGTNDNGESVASGIYLYKMKAGKYTSAKKMILMK